MATEIGTIEELRDEGEVSQELRYYQERGQLVRDNCQEYCAQILDTIDNIYEENPTDFPYICAGADQCCSQRIYQNFSSISNAFQSVVRRDLAEDDSREEILNCISWYRSTKLWTYGFICPLLEYGSSEEHQNARQMIRFEESTRLNMKKCDLGTVLATVNSMKAQQKVLPFFILDEMAPSENLSLAAFQRKVFRSCKLVVIVMGNDSAITDCMMRVFK